MLISLFRRFEKNLSFQLMLSASVKIIVINHRSSRISQNVTAALEYKLSMKLSLPLLSPANPETPSSYRAFLKQPISSTNIHNVQ